MHAKWKLQPHWMEVKMGESGSKGSVQTEQMRMSCMIGVSADRLEIVSPVF